ncbi:MAG: choice-of-anchor D domain-containing protein [Polyangiaceae bacterium]
MRGIALALFFACTLGACSAVLGIDDRTLRGDADNDGSPANLGDSAIDASDGGDIFDSERPDAPPSPLLPTTSIDFGFVGCGAAPPPSKSFTINNPGDVVLTWQATLPSTSSFSITGQSAGAIAPHGFQVVTVSSSGFPSYATAGQTEDATVSVLITFSGATPETHNVMLSETAAGATYTVGPQTASFGQVKMGTAATPIPIKLSNIGNVPMSLSFGALGDPQFSLENDAGSAVLAPGESVSGLVAGFTPSSTASSMTSVAIVAGGGVPMCGVSPSTLLLSGQGTNGPVTLQPGSLDFGLVNCGTGAAAKTITMINSGASFSWTASLGKGASSSYGVSPTSGMAATGVPVTITVTPLAIPSSAATTPDFFADTLTIVASDGPHSIPLHETAQGAILAESVSRADFGGVNDGTTATSVFTVTNSGNVSAGISFSTSNPAFGVTPQGQVVGGQGGSSTTTISFSPTTSVSYAGSTTMTVPGGTVLCAPLPAAISLSGTGTQNFVSVSPSSLDFGLVGCGQTGQNINVTISNTAPKHGASFNWTAALSKGASSPYALQASSGTVQANGSVQLQVKPNAIPQTSPITPDYFADTLTITTNAPNDTTPHVISLHQTAQGAIIVLSPSAINFGSVAGGATSTQSFQAMNNGNVPAQVNLTLGGGSGAYFSATPSGNQNVNGGSSITGSAVFHPPVGPTGAKSTTISTNVSGAQNCGGTITPITLSGTGT